ncbi:hypothetical protein DFP72DRAFT_1077351 [Ephemerocybe angulata]|uniref:Uncharacterized protein n=1 Tax=Ephemerocybe angulata TaxID=980116 RepID=A0A8H6HEW1_9AGAR|nr:hypothetical protein DFP72DRAFT_1077351 [Tulosesus angulatus]
MPWHSKFILSVASATQLPRVVSEELDAALQPLLMKISQREDTYLKKDNRNSQNLDFLSQQHFLFFDPTVATDTRLASLTNLSTERSSKLVSMLLDYRLVDVLLALQYGFSVAGQQRRLPIPLPPKMFFKAASNWPAMVQNGLQLVRKCNQDDPQPFLGSLDDGRNLIASIFSSLVYRKDAVEGHKIMLNFECAAAYLCLLLKGNLRLPNTVPEFRELVMDICRPVDLPTECWARFFSTMKSVHSFKLPLQLCLAISPICLFLPTCLMSKDLNRVTLLQMWQGLGGPRPRVLNEVDAILWEALLESALGRFPLAARLRSAFRKLEGIDVSRVGYPESEWLSGDPAFGRAESRATVATPSSDPPPSGAPSGTSATQDLLLEEPNSMENIRTATPVMNTPSRTITETASPDMNASSRPTTRSRTNKTSVPATLTAPRSVATKNGSRKRRPKPSRSRNVPAPPEMGQEPADPYEADEHSQLDEFGESDEHDDSLNEADGRDEHEEYGFGELSDGHEYEELEEPPNEPLPDRKRTLSRGEVPSAKRPKVSGTILYDPIDLVTEATAVERDILALEDRQRVERAYRGDPGALWDERSRTEYTPAFHFPSEAVWFRALFRAIKAAHLKHGGQPGFVMDSSESLFHILTDQDSRKISARNISKMLRSQNLIIVRTEAPIFSFDESGLSSIAMTDKPVQVLDFTLPPGKQRTVTGTLAQVVRHAQSTSGTMMVPDIPAPNGINPTSTLASDIVAWDMTIDQPWCSRRWEMPRSILRWTDVATTHAYTPLSPSPNGFVTQIEVKCGSQLLILFQPAPFSPCTSASFSFLEQVNQPSISNWNALSVEAFHLKPGHKGIVQPMVPFLLLSTENSITQMCHFYATSTIQASCLGFLHTALTGETFALSSQRASHNMLRRLAQYYLLIYQRKDYLLKRHDFPHVPDILTCEGVLDVLSLCNVFELVNVLSHQPSDLDRLQFIEARRVCRTISAWLDAHLNFSDRSGNRLNFRKDIYLRYLSRQARALQQYQEILDRRAMTSNAPVLQEGLATAFPENHEIHSQNVYLDGWIPDTFAWPSSNTFFVGLRNEVNVAEGEIKGETSDDREFLDSWGWKSG